MVMKRRSGTKSKIVEKCWTFLIYIFLHQQWKQCLEFTLAKLREICKYLAGACNSNSHAHGLHYLTFVCKNKAGKSTQRGESSQKCIKNSSALSLAWNAKKSLCKLNSLHCHQKTTTSLWKLEWKGNWRKKELRPQANNAQYNTQGWNVEGGERVKWEDSGGGGAASLCQLIYEPGEMVWQYT